MKTLKNHPTYQRWKQLSEPNPNRPMKGSYVVAHTDKIIRAGKGRNVWTRMLEHCRFQRHESQQKSQNFKENSNHQKVEGVEKWYEGLAHRADSANAASSSSEEALSKMKCARSSESGQGIVQEIKKKERIVGTVHVRMGVFPSDISNCTRFRSNRMRSTQRILPKDRSVWQYAKTRS
jgi:hypothetical protein